MRGFNLSEYQERIKKIRSLMNQKNLDIILVTSPHNFRYFTGFDSYFWESPARPWFLLIPLEKDPTLVVPSIGLPALEKTWVNNVISWSSPNPEDEGITTLKNVILDIKNNGIIGCELGKESYLRMSIKDYHKLCELSPNHQFVDASPLIWNMRMIKSNNGSLN